MTDEQLTDRILQVIAEHRLTTAGHNPAGNPLTFPDTTDQVRLCLAFFRRVRKIKTPSVGCYSLKHIIERDPDGQGKQYVTHGACVIAAYIAGLSMHVRLTRSTFVGLSMPDVDNANRHRAGWLTMPELTP